LSYSLISTKHAPNNKIAQQETAGSGRQKELIMAVAANTPAALVEKVYAKLAANTP
jgi:hypothetical protein